MWETTGEYDFVHGKQCNVMACRRLNILLFGLLDQTLSSSTWYVARLASPFLPVCFRNANMQTALLHGQIPLPAEDLDRLPNMCLKLSWLASVLYDLPDMAP
jgi:hypothetical protein